MIICKSCNAICTDEAVFCHKCGSKLEIPVIQEQPRIPHTMTVKEASEIFFQGRVSIGGIYKAIRESKIPYVRLLNGKLLLDTDELTKWWENELEKSKRIDTMPRLRRIT